jgi:hypothetical protein
MHLWLGAWLLASVGPMPAGECRAGEATVTPAHTTRTEPSGDQFVKLTVGQRNGQLCVQATYGSTEYVCLARRVNFDERNAAMALEGNVFVEIKGKTTMYAGQRVVVYPKKEELVIEQRNHDRDASVLSRERGPMQLTNGEKVWSEYKVEFLVRMGSRIEVLTLSDTEPSNFGEGSLLKVTTARSLLGDKPAEYKAGDCVNLLPSTESRKVMLVHYFGQEPRNWIPYDEVVEDKILALIKIGDAPITNARLNDLRKLKNLRTLDLYRTEISDDGLKELTNLKNLTVLDLNYTPITDAGLTELRDLKNLNGLDVGCTRITDSGLKAFGEFKNLTTLGLENTQITDAGLKQLRELKKLTTLDLKLTDAGMKELRRLTNLTTLDLNYTELTDAGPASVDRPQTRRRRYSCREASRSARRREQGCE